MSMRKFLCRARRPGLSPDHSGICIWPTNYRMVSQSGGRGGLGDSIPPVSICKSYPQPIGFFKKILFRQVRIDLPPKPRITRLRSHPNWEPRRANELSRKDQLKDIPIDQVAERLGLGLKKHGATSRENVPLSIQIGDKSYPHTTSSVCPFPAN